MLLILLPPLLILVPTRVAKCAAVMLVPKQKAEAEEELIQRVLAARQQLSVIEVEEVEEVVLDGRLVRRSSLIAIAAAVMELARG